VAALGALVGATFAVGPSAIAGAAPTSTLTVTEVVSSGLAGPTSVARDRAGDLFVVNNSSGSLTVTAAPRTTSLFGQHVTPGVPTAFNPGNSSTLDGLLHSPYTARFDAAGNLFIGFGNGSGGVVVVPASTTTVFGQHVTADTPVLLDPGIHGTLTGLADSVNGLTFDVYGDLWISNWRSDTIDVLPAVTTTLFGQSVVADTAVAVNPGGHLDSLLNAPANLAFDTRGNLYLANYRDNNLVVLPATSTTLFGDHVTADTASVLDPGNSGTLDHLLARPDGLGFDARGDLFVANAGGAITVVPAWSGSVFGQRVTTDVPVTFDPGTPGTLATVLAGPFDIVFDPNGDLYFPNLEGNNVYELSYPVGSTTAYRTTTTAGAVSCFGGVPCVGDLSGTTPNRPVVGMASTPDAAGYWLVASDGGIFSYGTALFRGSAGSLALNRPVVGMAPTPDGLGYWLVASDGGVFAYGDATFYGSAGALTLNRPVVGMAATPDGRGYWLVASDGGVFAYGDATFYGSAGALTLNRPVVGMAATPDGRGYWLVASDGGVFAYGDATFHGSTGGSTLDQPIVGMQAAANASGYWLVASDGGIFALGGAQFSGSGVGAHPESPTAGITG
jgi:hypothetical protein